MKTTLQTTQPAKKSGFTLIEIVIVLAIAALIMVIVFVAVQGAQRSRRDTTRKSDAARVLASLTQCAGDSNGSIGTPAVAGPPAVAAVNCATQITTSGGTASSSLTGPTVTLSAALPGPYARANGTNACPATIPDTSVTTNANGNVCVYYWSESAGASVLLAGRI